MKIRVLCVDDSPDITTILGQCIGREPDMSSVGALCCADDLLMQVKKLRPDVVLLDLTMPGKDPLEVLGQLAEVQDAGELVRVIVFSGHDDQRVMKVASKAGACGFLSKHADVPVILDAIRGAAKWNKGTDKFMLWA